ncbi:MAG TPA: GntR family transcriptional regulator [Acidimicrobiales bacterium]|nr:GntR family transcriptional regulator [Acidimicrobiales bacterium]
MTIEREAPTGGALGATGGWSSDPVHLPKAAEVIADRIRRDIVRGTLKEGDYLPTESKLLEQFKMSRPTLREALRVLEAENLISIHRGARGGARVRVPDASVAARYGGLVIQHNGGSLEDVLVSQHVLEAGAVRILATAGSPEKVELLRRSLDEEADVLDDLARFSACAVQFHESLIEATGNQSMILLAAMLREIVETHVRLVASQQKATPRRPRWRTKAHEVHAQVVDLIAAGKAAEAETLWRRHLVASGNAMRRQVDVANVVELFP